MITEIIVSVCIHAPASWEGSEDKKYGKIINLAHASGNTVLCYVSSWNQISHEIINDF